MRTFNPPQAQFRVLSPSGLCLQFMCSHELSDYGMCLCPETGIRGTQCAKHAGHFDDCEFAS